MRLRSAPLKAQRPALIIYSTMVIRGSVGANAPRCESPDYRQKQSEFPFPNKFQKFILEFLPGIDTLSFMPARRASSATATSRQFRGEVGTGIGNVRRRLGAIVEAVCGGTPARRTSPITSASIASSAGRSGTSSTPMTRWRRSSICPTRARSRSGTRPLASRAWVKSNCSRAR